MFSCHIDLEPKPAPRPRYSSASRRLYNEAWYKEYLQNIRLQVNKYTLGYCSSSLIALKLLFYKNTPIHHKRYGDIDNLAKGVMDALTGYLYHDDSQVLKIEAQKFQSENAGIDIYVDFLEG